MLKQLQERLRKAMERANTIRDKAATEARDMTADELKGMDEAMAEAETAQGQIERLQRQEALNAAVNAPARKSLPQDTEDRQDRVFAQPIRQLRAFAPRGGRTHREAEDRAIRSGMWVLAQLFQRPAAARYCQEHGIEVRAQSEGVNTAGGFLVPDELAATIIELREEYGTFRRFARIERMVSDTKKIPRRTSGLTAYFVGEGKEATESEKGVDQVTLVAKKLAVLAKFSNELGEDAVIDVAEDLAREGAIALALKEDQCGFDGTGISTYGGIVGIRTRMIDGSHTKSYATAPGAGNSCDTWDEVGDDDLLLVAGQLPGYAVARDCAWYCPVGARYAIFERLLRAASGNTVQTLSGSAAPTLYYMGFPVRPVPAWTDTAATDNSSKIIVMLGALELAAALGDRRDVRMELARERYIEYGQVGVFVTERMDINVHDLGDAATAGPLVGLYGN